MAGPALPDRPRKPLVRCARCDSRRLVPVRIWTLADRRCVVQRHCPDCAHADAVRADPLAVDVWRRRTLRRHAEVLAG